MPKANDTPKRDMITFYINAQVRKSAASCRFIEEYRASGEHAEKREKFVSALRSGQIMEEAGLLPVMQFVDRDAFKDMDERQRQLLILARLQEYLGVIPQPAPVSAVATAQQQVVTPEQGQSEPPPAAISEAVQAQATPEPENPPAPASEPEKPVNDKPAEPVQPSRFASKLPGA